MNISIRKLKPKSIENLEDFMERNTIGSKSGAIDAMLEDYNRIYNLEMQRNLLQEQNEKLELRYEDLVKSLNNVNAHLKNYKDGK
jgi:hypothetical protein